MVIQPRMHFAGPTHLPLQQFERGVPRIQRGQFAPRLICRFGRLAMRLLESRECSFRNGKRFAFATVLLIELS